MTLNPNIPLQVQGIDIATPVRNYADRMVQKEQIAKQDELRDIQILNEKYNMLDNREKSRINSVTMMAAELQPLLEKGNTEAVRKRLQSRRSNLQKAMADGIQVDTSETDQALQLLESGDTDSLKQMMSDQVKFGQMTGILKSPDDGGFTLGEGQLRYDAQGNVIASGPAKTPDSVVNVNTGEGFQNVSGKKAAEKLGEGIGKRINSRIELAQEGLNQNANLDVFAQAIETDAANSGFGQEAITRAKSLAQTFGIDTGSLAGEELIIKIGSELALRARNPESGLGLTGNTSNRDLSFLKSVNPNIINTKQGNLAMIEVMKALNNMKMAVVTEQNRIISKNNGVPPNDLDEQLMKFVNRYDFMSDELQGRLENLGALGSEQQTNQPTRLRFDAKGNPL